MLRIESAGIVKLNGQYKQIGDDKYIKEGNENISIMRTYIPELYLPLVWVISEFVPHNSFTIHYYVNSIEHFPESLPPAHGWGCVAGIEPAPQIHGGENKIIKAFEWRFKQRPSLKEMLDRGIISQSDYAIIGHEADIEDSDISTILSKYNTAKYLDNHLSPKSRMSKEDLEQRNIVPQGSFDDAWVAQRRVNYQRRHSHDELQRRLIDRSKPNEIFSRGILKEEELQKDYEIIRQEHERYRQQIIDKLDQKMQHRPSRYEMAESGKIDPLEFIEDHEQVVKDHQQEVQELKNKLENKIYDRPSRYEMAESGKIDPLEFVVDHEQVVKEHAHEIQVLKDKLDHKIQERPGRYQMAESGKIDPLEFVMDHEQVVAEKKKDMEQLKTQLDDFIQHHPHQDGGGDQQQPKENQ